MIDIKIVRQDPLKAQTELGKRGVNPDEISKLLDLDSKRRNLINEVESMKKHRNEVSDEIAVAKKQKQAASSVIKEMQELSQKIKDYDEQLKVIEADQQYILERIPNFPAPDVPVGPDESYNEELNRYGELKKFDFTPKAHYELGEELGILDFSRAAKVSGSRFVYYIGLGAKLERAIYNFFLDQHERQGYIEVLPPYLVNDHAMYGTSQFPKFIGDSYAVNEESGALNLIPTAEVPLTNYYSNEIIDDTKLPVEFTALAPSFRSEAGSAGRDTRGLIRMHQFNKVEMVKYVRPETSWDELEKLTGDAKELLDMLEIPYRQIVLATGDASFSSAKTYDLEVFMPNQDRYREISSCSNCTDFQARRAKIRYRDENGKAQFVHTLNGSGLAVGRTVAAIMENYQNADGSITIPKVLIPYMNGITKITKENATNY